MQICGQNINENRHFTYISFVWNQSSILDTFLEGDAINQRFNAESALRSRSHIDPTCYYISETETTLRTCSPARRDAAVNMHHGLHRRCHHNTAAVATSDDGRAD